jgi:hypothetical protein
MPQANRLEIHARYFLPRRDGRGPVAPVGFVTWSYGNPCWRPADH